MLARLARQILAIPVSSASSERVFSSEHMHLKENKFKC